MSRKLRLSVGIGLAALVLAGCGVQSGMAGAPMGGMQDHMAGGFGSDQGTLPPAIRGAAEVTVVATEFQFEPAVVTVTAGAVRNVRFTNRGATLHDFAVPDVGLRIVAAPGEQTSTSFVAPTQGVYETRCTYPGHADLGMVGTLIVESA